MNNPRRSNGTRRNHIRARLKASGQPCWICEQPIDYSLRWPDPWSLVIDEAIPVKYGGNPLDITNCRPAHAWCNRQRSTHSIQWARKNVPQILAHGKTKTKPIKITKETNKPSTW